MNRFPSIVALLVSVLSSCGPSSPPPCDVTPSACGDYPARPPAPARAGDAGR